MSATNTKPKTPAANPMSRIAGMSLLDEGVTSEGVGTAIIISAGVTLDGVWDIPASIIKQSAAVFAGLPMYLNHQGEIESYDHPNRKEQDIVAYIIGTPVWSEEHQGLKANYAVIDESFHKRQDARKKHGLLDRLEISVYTVFEWVDEPRMIAGKQSTIRRVTGLKRHPFSSVDFVTVANAAGKVLSAQHANLGMGKVSDGPGGSVDNPAAGESKTGAEQSPPANYVRLHTKGRKHMKQFNNITTLEQAIAALQSQSAELETAESTIAAHEATIAKQEITIKENADNLAKMTAEKTAIEFAAQAAKFLTDSGKVPSEKIEGVIAKAREAGIDTLAKFQASMAPMLEMIETPAATTTTTNNGPASQNANRGLLDFGGHLPGLGSGAQAQPQGQGAGNGGNGNGSHAATEAELSEFPFLRGRSEATVRQFRTRLGKLTGQGVSKPEAIESAKRFANI